MPGIDNNTLALLKKDFSMDTLEIRKVGQDTDLAEKLIRFVENRLLSAA